MNSPDGIRLQIDNLRRIISETEKSASSDQMQLSRLKSRLRTLEYRLSELEEEKENI